MDKFDPWRAPRGLGRKTRPKPWSTQGVYENGNDFQEKDEWQLYNTRKHEQPRSVSPLWTGRTMFIVNRGYSKQYGTDQRRQRETVANLSEHHTSWGENLIMPDSWSERHPDVLASSQGENPNALEETDFVAIFGYDYDYLRAQSREPRYESVDCSVLLLCALVMTKRERAEVEAVVIQQCYFL